MYRFILLSLVAVVVPVGAARAFATPFVSGSASGSALDPRISTSATYDSVVFTQPPYSSQTSAIRGSARNVTSYEFSHVGNVSIFAIDFSQQIPESYGPFNYAGQVNLSGNILISLPQGGSYDVTGLFQTSGVTPRVDLRAQIRDATTSADIFHSYQVSNSSSSSSSQPRQIDVTQAPAFSTFVGSPTGILPPGDYRLMFTVGSSNSFTPNALGTLAGNFDLRDRGFRARALRAGSFACRLGAHTAGSRR